MTYLSEATFSTEKILPVNLYINLAFIYDISGLVIWYFKTNVINIK